MPTLAASQHKPRSLYGFWALIATQFQGAFNDNVFRLVIILYLMDHYKGAAADAGMTANYVTAVATMLFSLPYLIFPVLAGGLADRFSKKRVAVWTKVWEVGVMALGYAAFRIESPALLWFTLFLMMTQSAFFSPAKYGILPEILPHEKLSWGNGILNMGTFLAIILGTAAAGPLRDLFGDRTHLVSLALIAFSFLGLLTSLAITPAPTANPAQRIPLAPWHGLGKYFRVFWEDRWLFLTMLGIVYFFFAGSILQNNVLRLGEVELDLASDTAKGLLMASLALGIGLGSVAAGYLSNGKIEVGLVPFGALGIAVCGVLLAIPGYGYQGALLLLFAIGFFAGVYDVPLAALLQQRSPEAMRGGIIATSNVVVFLGVFAAGGLYYLFGVLNLSSYTVFLLAAAATVVVAVYICRLLPVFFLRFILWCLGHTFYRVKAMGRDNVPEKGGALLVVNHTAFLDALIVLISIDRPVRFIMAKSYYEVRWIRPLVKLLGAIPVSAQGNPRDLVASLQEAQQAVADGHLVCIFAEGQITRTGQMLPFKKGFERIMKGAGDAPIIPVYLDRAWGSVFSFSEGRFLWKWPSRIPYPITVNFGKGLPADSTAFAVRQAIMELGTEAHMARRPDAALLHRMFVREVRKHPFRTAVADGIRGKLSYLKTYAGSLILAGKLREALGEHPMVGVLLPSTIGGALTNIALQVMGKVPINLNYTVSPDSLESAARQCELRQIITAKAFLEKLPLEVPGEPIYLEDIMASVRPLDRIKGLLATAFVPVRVIERRLGAPGQRSVDDLATVIFSSGSEGEPKGVMLSHFNLVSNIEAAYQVFQVNRRAVMVGFLPFFHSFGFMATIWLPLCKGFGALYHPNPLDPRAIGVLIRQYKATFLVGTSTLLQGFIRRCTPEELASLKYVICGAEKLAPRVRDAFLEKFGVEPLEGYGTTECSPAVAVSMYDYRAPGFYQKAHKRGSIGLPLPGVSVKVVNPETGEPLAENEPGMLLVKGPNIMLGYLDQPEKTAKVLRDGWYETGDIAAIDEDGFIFITDRLSRFSKIGGEMVPHVKVEDAMHHLLDLHEQHLAVASVADPVKGERLVVLHTLDDGQLDALLERLERSDLPKLWIPKANAFYRIDAIPVQGTGKVDLKTVKELAVKLDVGE